MFEAQLLIAKSAGNVVVSPWFPRGGDYLRATVEVVNLAGSAGVTVNIKTKESDETGDGSDVSGSLSQTSVGRSAAQEWGPSVLKDLVRYKFTVTSETATDWTLFRMLPPVWFDAVEA